MSLSLPRIIGLPEAHDLAGALCQSVDRSQALVIDGADVQRIGLAGLQILLAAHTAARGAGLDFRLVSPSQHLSDMAALTGLHDLLLS